MQFFRTPNVNFIGARHKAMLISAVVLVIGLASIGIHKGFRTSIDFAGGSLVEIQLENPIPLQEIRSLVGDAGFDGAEVTNFGALNEYLIKVKAVGNAADVAETIKTALTENIKDQAIDIRRTETVGPKIGSELRNAMFWAIIYSLLGIVVYVSWRFEFRFAIAAIVALIHDVLFTLGFFSVINMEISLAVIAAILTIVGYSLNDTIVVFDRVRENIHSKRREAYDKLVNNSINEVLSRTIITSVTTLFVVLALVIFGGEVIKDFALTLLVGVFIGTYSSIFIANPVLVEWHQWRAGRGAGKPAKPNKTRKR
jgi:preprotein translocase subunit SecF